MLRAVGVLPWNGAISIHSGDAPPRLRRGNQRTAILVQADSRLTEKVRRSTKFEKEPLAAGYSCRPASGRVLWRSAVPAAKRAFAAGKYRSPNCSNSAMRMSSAAAVRRTGAVHRNEQADIVRGQKPQSRYGNRYRVAAVANRTQAIEPRLIEAQRHAVRAGHGVSVQESASSRAVSGCIKPGALIQMGDHELRHVRP